MSNSTTAMKKEFGVRKGETIKTVSVVRRKATDEEIWIITPEKAQQLLDTNPNDNRTISWSQVYKYARDMREGRWDFYTGKLALAPDGKLLDGQHRMLALIEANMTLDFQVSTNVPPTTLFDKNKPRSTTDSFKIGKMLDDPDLLDGHVTDMVSAFLTVMLGGPNKSRLTDKDIAEFINDHPSEIKLADKLTHNSHAMVHRAAVGATFIAAAMCGITYDVLKEFADIVNTSVAPSPEKTAPIRLRDALVEAKNGGGGRQRHLTIASIASQSLQDFVANKKRSHVYKTGPLPYFDELYDVVAKYKD